MTCRPLKSGDAGVPRDGTGTLPTGPPRGGHARGSAAPDPSRRHGLEHRAPAQERRRRPHLVRPGRDRARAARQARPARRPPLLGRRGAQVRLRAAAPGAAHRGLRRGVPPLRLAPRHALERPRARRPPAAREAPGRRHRRPQHGRPGRASCSRPQGRRAHRASRPARRAQQGHVRLGPGAARYLPAHPPRGDARPQAQCGRAGAGDAGDLPRALRPAARRQPVQGLRSVRSRPVARGSAAGGGTPRTLARRDREAAAAGRPLPPDRGIRPGHRDGPAPVRPQARLRPRSRGRRHRAARPRPVAGTQDLVRRGKPRLAAGQRGRRPRGRGPRAQWHDHMRCRRCCRAGAACPPSGRKTSARHRSRRSPGATSPSANSASSCTSSSASRCPRRPPPHRSGTLRRSRSSSPSWRAASRRAARPRSCSAPLRTSSRPAPPGTSTGCCTARSATSRAGARSTPPPARCSCCRSGAAAWCRDWSCSRASGTSRVTTRTCSGSRRPTSRGRSRSRASRTSPWCSGARPPAPVPRTRPAPSSRAC